LGFLSLGGDNRLGRSLRLEAGNEQKENGSDGEPGEKFHGGGKNQMCGKNTPSTPTTTLARRLRLGLWGKHACFVLPRHPAASAFYSFTAFLMPDQSATSWAETAASLLTKLSGGVELNLNFDQVELQVPNQANPAGAPATWKLNGALRIRTKGEAPTASAPLISPAPDPNAPRG
jgi:hypothetical protein